MAHGSMSGTVAARAHQNSTRFGDLAIAVWRHRSLIAVIITAIAGGLVALVGFTLLLAPFALFVAAAGLSWLYGRMGPALLPITLATLTSDFLVVRPRYEFTLNLTTAGLGATYAAGALLNRIFVCWAAKRG